MADAGGVDVAGVLRRLAKSSESLSTPQVRELCLFCEAAKEALELAANDLVSDAAGWPILCSRPFDGAHMQTTTRRVHVAGPRQIRSAGKASHELLAKYEFLRCYIRGQGWASRVILKEATSLVLGKAAPAILAPCCKEWKTLRARGHTGPAIEHMFFDRAGCTALERVTRQLHMEDCRTYGDLAPEKPAKLQPLSELLLYTPCAIHDAQNAFRRVHLSLVQYRNFMRTIYIGVESLLNGIDCIDLHMGSWAARKMRFVEHMSAEWEDHQRSLWTLLDVDPDLVGALVDLQLRFENGNLLISCTHQGRLDVVTTAVGLLGAMWRFKKRTESRLLTVGSSARLFVARLLTGVGGLVEEICDRGVKDWYLKGFKNDQQEHMNFMVQAAVTFRVAEAFQQELMHDSRVALRLHALAAVISEEMCLVTQM